MDILQAISVVSVFMIVIGLGGIGILKMLLEHDEKKQKTNLSDKSN